MEMQSALQPQVKIKMIAKCMFCLFRPSFEVVKEGRIYQLGPLKIKKLQPQKL